MPSQCKANDNNKIQPTEGRAQEERRSEEPKAPKLFLWLFDCLSVVDWCWGSLPTGVCETLLFFNPHAVGRVEEVAHEDGDAWATFFSTHTLWGVWRRLRGQLFFQVRARGAQTG